MTKPEDSPMGSVSAAFDLTLRQREFEISQLTQRNNFFMIFQGVIIAGLVQSGGTAAPILTFSVCLLGIAVSAWQTLMAAGAKFWQMRWERATRNLEIALLTDLKTHPHVFQFFTSDTNFLSQAEEQRLGKVNQAPARSNDKLEMRPGLISQWVREDLDLDGAKLKWWHWTNRLPSRLILSKPSVSRLPIAVGLGLLLFWLFLLLHTMAWGPEWLHGFIKESLHLVQLKADSPGK